MNTESFGATLNTLRKERGLTVQELATRAGVHQSLISSLNNDKRVIGEVSARKIGRALNLHEEELERFVYQAINNSSERLLTTFKEYPAEVVNLAAMMVAVSGISPDEITRCVNNGYPLKPDVTLYLNGGKTARVKVEVDYD